MDNNDDIDALWYAAVSEYNKTNAVDQKLRLYSIDQVLAMTVEKEEYFKRWRNDKGKLDKFRSVLKSSLGPLNALGQFVSANASAIFPPTATICTAVSYMIQTANSVSADYDLLVTFFDELRLFLERLKIVDAHIPESKDIRRCLVDILALILKIIDLSVKTMNNGRGLRFLKDLVQGEDEEIKKHYKRLEKLVQQEECLMIHQLVANTSEALGKLDSMDSKVDDGFATTKRMETKTDTVLVEIRKLQGDVDKTKKADYLSTIRQYFQPQSVDDYTKKCPRLLNGTATWLLDEPTFGGWTSALSPRILWISGAPGTGKSFLSTFSIKQLLQDARGTVAYYYFHDNNPNKRSVINALSAMVHQIARADEVYCLHAAAACKESVGMAGATITSIWEDFFVALYGPSTRCGQLYLVFDGIDEAEREDIIDFVGLLSIEQQLRIQVLLVGRPDMDQIVATLDTGSTAKIEVSIKKNSADIMRYITYTYDHSPKMTKRQDFRQKVTSALLEASNGMFLWVDLVLHDLSERSQPRQILGALKVLPKELNKVYDKILKGIEVAVADDDDERQSLRELFCWVTHSTKPPSLFELNLIVQFLCEDELFDVEINVNKHCPSLITLTKTRTILLDEILKSNDDGLVFISAVKTADSPEPLTSESDDDDEPDTEWAGDADGTIAGQERRIAEASGDESDEETAHVEATQRDIIVELRHPSLGDYFRNPKAKTTTLIYACSEARVRIVISTMRMFCQGSQIEARLWQFALKNWMTQLQDLDEKTVSDADTKTIVEHLVEIFYSSTELQKHIFGQVLNVGLHYFHFGYNNDLEHPARVTIQKWFKKVVGTLSITLDKDISEWVHEILQHPMKLLVPLAKLCISEWLKTVEETFFLYWRFRLGFQLLLSTDLVPTLESSNIDPVFKCPEFIPDSDVVYVADFFTVDRDLETYCRVARCISFAGYDLDNAVAMYQMATENLIDANLDTQLPILQSTLLELAMAFEGSPYPNKVLVLIEQYLALDQTNQQAYTCLGGVLWKFGRTVDAIEALSRALDLQPMDAEAARRLIGMMMIEKRYQEIMTLLETKGRARCTWIAGNIAIPSFHTHLFYAGLATGKLELLSDFYQSTIAQIRAGPLRAFTDLPAEGARMLASRWLALLYQRYIRKPDRAFSLYREIFFRSTAFWRLGHWNIIPLACENFGELIYEKANSSHDGENNVQVMLAMTTMLERLCACQAASEAITQEHWGIYCQKTLNVLLSKLYVRCGRKADADLLLREQAQRGIDLLQDDLD